MPVISIREQGPLGSADPNVTISFDHREEYHVSLHDPFSAEDEQTLEWYFEDHLQFPMLETIRAEHAAASVTSYGHDLFRQLFGAPDLYARYQETLRDGIGALVFEIAGSPDFHRLHWEALKDPKFERPFAVDTTMLRANIQPRSVHARTLPSPTINVLVVTARPLGKRDVGYRTISRPLVESLRQAQLRVQIDIVRPGTFEALVKKLDAVTETRGPGYYHVIHFDVHGALATYDEIAASARAVSPHFFDTAVSPLADRFARPKLTDYDGQRAYLYFEGAQPGVPDAVEASELATLLLKHQIPIAILNACQSGKQVGATETSLGSHLLQAGIQVVLAMGYSVTVSAAKLLMTALYRELFDGAATETAIRRGRAELYQRKWRQAYFNQQIALEDWLLPVFYQNYPQQLRMRAFTDDESAAYSQRQSSRFAPPTPTYGFVGRDLDVLALERLLLAQPQRNEVLVQGMGGAGKSTLLRHLGWWWQTTGLVDHVWYFGYDEQSWTRQQLLVAIGERLVGEDRYHREWQMRSLDEQQTAFCQQLRAERHLLILDNLESITGVDLAIQHTLSPQEQRALQALLRDLSGGKTLVLLGSRSDESWLADGTFADNRYPLPGLDPEAASTLANAVLTRSGAAQYRDDPALKRLLTLLDGYPLAIEVVLANLTKQSPTDVLAALEAGAVEGLDASLPPATSATDARTRSILKCIDYSHSNLAPGSQLLLLCLAPFTAVILRPGLADYTEALQRQPALADLPFDQWDIVLQQAENGGLVTTDPAIPDFLRLQPIFPYFLRERLNTLAASDTSATTASQSLPQAIETAFRDHYTQLAGELLDLVNSRDAKQRTTGIVLMRYEFENVYHALRLALAVPASIQNLYGALAYYLDAVHQLERGLALGQETLTRLEAYPPDTLPPGLQIESIAIQGDVGTRYLARKRYPEAKALYQNAFERLGKIADMQAKERAELQASTLHQLGRVAQEQRQFPQATDYYQQALALKVAFDDRYEQASTLHQLGRVAQEQRQFPQAEQYYQQALAIYVAFDDRYSQAGTLHQLGRVAEEQRQFPQAEQYYQQALALKIEFDDRHSQATTLHQLGRVAQEQRQFPQATDYFIRALAIFLTSSDDHSTSIVLGSLARLWQASDDAAIPQQVASAGSISVSEAETLLRRMLSDTAATDDTDTPAGTDQATSVDSGTDTPQGAATLEPAAPPALAPASFAATAHATAPAQTPPRRRFPTHPLLFTVSLAALLLMLGFYAAFLTVHQLVWWPVLVSWALALAATLAANVQAGRSQHRGWLVAILLLTIASTVFIPGLGALLFAFFGPKPPPPKS